MILSLCAFTIIIFATDRKSYVTMTPDYPEPVIEVAPSDALSGDWIEDTTEIDGEEVHHVYDRDITLLGEAEVAFRIDLIPFHRPVGVKLPELPSVCKGIVLPLVAVEAMRAGKQKAPKGVMVYSPAKLIEVQYEGKEFPGKKVRGAPGLVPHPDLYEA
jgi:hypothetical protein